ncbi:MAG TPA: ribonuclease III [Thermoanaerobaculia bacterium]|jgi:ribonuclease-3|nr:ribonuclease III [Thermoanaerobaculia bacterium]
MAFGRRPATPLEERLGYRFKRLDLLSLALTHRSWANEQGIPEHYERLEFLGDSVLGLISAEWLYIRYPELPEGELSKLKAQLVSRPALARHAEEIGLGSALKIGVGEERSGGRTKASLLADSMEAVIGALYLDGGLEVARKVVEPMMKTGFEERASQDLTDSKTQLQEVSQALGWALPEYRLTAASGPDHNKVFVVECWLAGELGGTGEGPSKKVAEQRAAADALARLPDLPEK